MPFNVDTFNSEIAQSGVANPSFFEARIVSGPLSIRPMMRNGMAFRIESVNIPGRTLTTLDQNYHGPVRRIPYRFTNQPVTFTVILSRDMREREAFMKWQDEFIGHYRTNYRGPMTSEFDSHYYEDAIGEIEIIQYSYPIVTPASVARPPKAKEPPLPGNQENPPRRTQRATEATQGYIEAYNISLKEAYPSSVNDIQMAWGDEGYGKLQVELTYRYAVEAQKTFYNPAQADRERNNHIAT
jgi:hypothetical protein